MAVGANCKVGASAWRMSIIFFWAQPLLIDADIDPLYCCGWYPRSTPRTSLKIFPSSIMSSKYSFHAYQVLHQTKLARYNLCSAIFCQSQRWKKRCTARNFQIVLRILQSRLYASILQKGRFSGLQSLEKSKRDLVQPIRKRISQHCPDANYWI